MAVCFLMLYKILYIYIIDHILCSLISWQQYDHDILPGPSKIEESD